MLDVRRLRVLRAVSQHGSFSAAAEALSYTQSAVSQQIAALEREAGTLLVQRNARGVRLTDAGTALVRHTEVILSRLADAEGPVILMCAEGYASSLAAATLQDLGLTEATDMAGGFVAWRAAGLPVERLADDGVAAHWDRAYMTLGDEGVSWFEAVPATSLELIGRAGARPDDPIVDVGGGASKEKVTAAFKIILKDPAVKGILVNIFGGIMRCDIIAEGIVAAAKDVNLSVPLVVRLEGTNVQQGKDILAQSGLAIVPADDLGDAAKKIVAEVRKAA